MFTKLRRLFTRIKIPDSKLTQTELCSLGEHNVSGESRSRRLFVASAAAAGITAFTGCQTTGANHESSPIAQLNSTTLKNHWGYLLANIAQRPFKFNITDVTVYEPKKHICRNSSDAHRAWIMKLADPNTRREAFKEIDLPDTSTPEMDHIYNIITQISPYYFVAAASVMTSRIKYDRECPVEGATIAAPDVLYSEDQGMLMGGY